MNGGTQIDTPSGADAAAARASPGKLYDAGVLLVMLAAASAGLGCLLPWVSYAPIARLELASFHTWIGALLIAAAIGIAFARRMRRWAAFAGAAALLAAAAVGSPFPPVMAVHDTMIRLALIGALFMVAGREDKRDGGFSRWFRAGRLVFAVCALTCMLAQAVFSRWLQDGFDMFYFNYDAVTLFNSMWSWSYLLGWIFGISAALGTAALFFRRWARVGAIFLAAASVLFLPLLFLYRFDDFCGAGRALVELLYAWLLDLGLAGGALVVIAAARPAINASGAISNAWTRIAGRRRVRMALQAFGLLLMAAIVFHGLVPLFFYEANARGHAKLGDLAARVYAAFYLPSRGNSYFRDELSNGIRDAAPAGRRCAAGDAEGCAGFAAFYRGVGWNWSRAGRFSVRADQLFANAAAQLTPRCENGEARACFDLGMQNLDGQGMPQNLDKAVALLQKACDAQQGDACAHLGDLYWEGRPNGNDEATSMALLKKGCALGSKWGCEQLHQLNEVVR